MEHTQFWLVWREDGYSPTYRHRSKAEALTEAERLAKANPGNVFFVLKATAGVLADNPNTRRVKFVPDLIPF